MYPFLKFRKYKDKTVLVVQAHTDDADFNCGATVNRLSKHDTNPANNPQPPKRYRKG